ALGAAVVWIPDQVGLAGPRARQRDFQFAGDIRLPVGLRPRVVQRNVAVGEVEQLPDRGAQSLGAGVRARQARGNGRRRVVGVAHAIGPVGAILFEQFAVGKGGRAGIEQRQLLLVFTRVIQVKEPWFEGLRVLVTPGGEITLQVEGVVQA